MRVGLALVLLLPATVAQDFAETLRNAPWGGSATSDSLTLAARRAPFCSQAMLDAVAKGPLPEVARVTFAEKGWFMSAAVEPGAYAIGIAGKPDNLRFVLRDPKGDAVGGEGFWINTPSPETPSVSIAAEGSGVATARLVAGGITFTFKFIPKARHDAIAAGARETRAGPVSVFTDVDEPGLAKALAKEAAASIPVHARLLGKPVPKGRFPIYVLREKKTYEAFDAFLTGGRFKNNAAFTSHATHASYVVYWPVPGAGATHKLRSIVLHELHHQVAEALFPSQGVCCPTWLVEGVAEVAAHAALRARSKDDAAHFHDQMRAQWSHGTLRRSRPHLEDLMAGAMGGDIPTYYAGAYLLARRLARRPNDLRAIFSAAAAESTPSVASGLARAELARRFGPAATLFRPIEEGRHPSLPVPLFGHMDRVRGALRMVAVRAGQSRAVWTGTLPGPDVEVATEFAWVGGKYQADVYLAYSEGRSKTQFLKVAVAPDYCMLFRFRHGTWSTVGRVNYDTKLKIGAGVWHPLKVRYVGKARRVRVETTGGRWAEFQLSAFVPTAHTRYGIGSFNGIVDFREPVAK